MSLWKDLRFGVRVLIKDRWFTLAAVLALALGLGATTAVYTMAHAMLLRGLPYEEPEQIVTVMSRHAEGQQAGVSIRDFEDWRDSARLFEATSLVWPTVLSISDDLGQPALQTTGAFFSGDLFPVVRQQPMLGRAFTADDDRLGSEPVIMLGYGLWQTRYGSDPSIVGRVLRVASVPHTIIGVMPQGMDFPSNAEAWIPHPNVAIITPPAYDTRREYRAFQVIGRLATGVTVAQAQAELTAIGAGLAAEYPDTNTDWSPWVRTWNETAAGPQLSLVVWSLMGAVAFVLLIACANVANLLLARAGRRAHEVSVRASLGATRWRLVRQLLVESVLLAGVSGVVGLGLAIVGIRAFGAAIPDGLPSYMALTLDPPVFLFLALICLLTAVVFGLAPALYISKTNVHDVLKEGGRSGAGLRARRWTGALLVGELALTLTLLAGAGFMMRSFLTLYTQDVGIDTSNLVTMQLILAPADYPTPDSQATFVERLEEEIATMPEIEAGTVMTSPPLFGGNARRLAIVGRPVPVEGDAPFVTTVGVGPGYFEALGVRIARGRPLQPIDNQPGQDNAVVNEQFVAMHFPGEDPLGQRIRFLANAMASPLAGARNDTTVTIVGVSSNVRQRGQDRDPDPVVYVPYATQPALVPWLLVRPRAAVGAAVDRVRAEVQRLDPNMPVSNVQTLDALLAQQRWPFRVFGSMFSLFAGIALLLSVIGLYAATAFSVTQRTREIGVRMALGAEAGQVLWLFARRAVLYLGLGLAIGLAGAVGVGRLLESLLVGPSSTDPPTLIAIVLILIVVGAVASLWPARRAARVDPALALRHE
jgi:predicted permease